MKQKQIVGILAAGAVVAACATVAPGAPSAVADLAPTAGSAAKGTVTFTQRGDKIAVAAKIAVAYASLAER